MTDETQVEEEFEEEFEESIEDGDTSEEDSEDSDDTDTQKQKKPNGFKKMREELKATKKALAEATKSKNEVKLKPDQELDSRFFFIENPEAKDFKDDIKATIARFPNMTFDEAYAYLKATKPKPSESKTDFSFRSKSKPADINNMSDDEAAEKLSASEYLKYSRDKGSQFIKPNLLRK